MNVRSTWSNTMQNVSVYARLTSRAAYSYRNAPDVPSFPDDKPLIVFDGVCVLCSGFVRFVVARDPHATFRFVSAQSPLGQALFRHYDLDTDDFETNLLIADGRAHGKLDAFTGVMDLLGDRLGGIYRLALLAKLLPRPLRDWLYDRIARNRYLLFGRTDACIVPDASWRGRVLE